MDIDGAHPVLHMLNTMPPASLLIGIYLFLYMNSASSVHDLSVHHEVKGQLAKCINIKMFHLTLSLKQIYDCHDKTLTICVKDLVITKIQKYTMRQKTRLCGIVASSSGKNYPLKWTIIGHFLYALNGTFLYFHLPFSKNHCEESSLTVSMEDTANSYIITEDLS